MNVSTAPTPARHPPTGALNPQAFGSSIDRLLHYGLDYGYIYPSLPAQAPKPKLEMNFIEFFVLPLYQALAVVLPEVNLCVEQIVANHEQWDVMLNAAP